MNSSNFERIKFVKPTTMKGVKIKFSPKAQKKIKSAKVRYKKTYKKLENREFKRWKVKERKARESDFKDSFGLVQKIFSLLLIFLIVVLFVRWSQNNFILPSFTSFLEMLDSMSVQPIKFSMNAFGGDWGIFDFLREILSTLFGILDFILTGLWTALKSLFYIIRWAFV